MPRRALEMRSATATTVTAPGRLQSANSHELTERVLVTGLMLTAVAVAGQTLLHFVDAYALDRRVEMFDAGGEGGLSTWASATATFAAGFVLILLAFLRRERGRTLVGLAAVVIFFSLDDGVSLHERTVTSLVRSAGLATEYRHFWPALFVPLLAVCLLGLWRLAGEGPRLPGRAVRVGLAALGVALALEMAVFGLLRLWVSSSDWPFVVESALEEAAELAGWSLVLTGLTCLLLAEIEEQRGQTRV